MSAFAPSVPLSAARLRWPASTAPRNNDLCSPLRPLFSCPQLSLSTTKPKSKPRAPSPTPSSNGAAKATSKSNAKPKPKGKTGKRVGTYRKLQARHKVGPSVFRSNAQTLLTKDGAITQAEDGSSLSEGYRNNSDGTINGIANTDLEKQQLKARRRDRRNATPLRELQVGSKVEGVVHNTVRHGVYVDIGAKADGLVHLRDMSVDFVHEVEDIVRPGDKLTVWIKYVDPVANVLALTMLPPALGFEGPRTTIKDIKLGARVTGIVERVTNFGAYVDAGFERHAWIHVRKLWGRQPCETLQGLKLGQRVYAQVVNVDEVRSYVSLTARGRGGVKLSEGVAIEIDGEDLKLSYGDASTDRQPIVRLDQNDIRARATLRVGEELNDGFASGSVRLTSEDGEEDDDDDDDDDENVFQFVQSEITDSVVDQGIDVEGLAAQFKAEDEDEDNDDSDFDDDDDDFAFAEEMGLMGDGDKGEADYSEIAHMLTENTEFIGLQSTEIEKLKQVKRRIKYESGDGNDSDRNNDDD